MKKKILKEFVWWVIVFIITFPLALIPLSISGVMIYDLEAFLLSINNHVISVYLLYVVTLLIMFISARVVYAVIGVLFK